MTVRTRRRILAPLRQWRAHHLIRQHGPSLDYPTAWALITLGTSPREFAYVQQATHEAGSTADAGLHHGGWEALTPEERTRRKQWLARRGKTPIQRLGTTPDHLKRAGLRVVDWSLPEGHA